AGRFPRHVGRHAGPFDRDPVAPAVARRARIVGIARQGPVVRRPEAVTERAALPAERDRRLALPPGPVCRVERVDVEAAAVPVVRRAVLAGPEPVYGVAELREPAEQI